MELDLVIVKGDLSQLKKELLHVQEDVSQLQKDVSQLQKDVSQLQKDVSQLQQDVSQVQKDISQLLKEISQLQNDISQLQKDVSKLQADGSKLIEEVVGIRIELAELNAAQSNYATRADLKALQAEVIGVEANIKGWMLVIALSLMTSTFAMVYPLYGLSKAPALIPAPQAQQQYMPPRPQAPVDLR